MNTFRPLTKFQKQALFYAAFWDQEHGGVAPIVDGRSAQTLIKRGWMENCVVVKTGLGGVMTSGMGHVITTQGREAAREHGWEPSCKLAPIT